MATEFPQEDFFDGICISAEDAKSIITILQTGMVEVTDEIEKANIKTQLATERTQERLFQAEEDLRMKFDESKRLNELLKEAINENEKNKQRQGIQNGTRDCCQSDSGESCPDSGC